MHPLCARFKTSNLRVRLTVRDKLAVGVIEGVLERDMVLDGELDLVIVVLGEMVGDVVGLGLGEVLMLLVQLHKKSNSQGMLGHHSKQRAGVTSGAMGTHPAKIIIIGGESCQSA